MSKYDKVFEAMKRLASLGDKAAALDILRTIGGCRLVDMSEDEAAAAYALLQERHPTVLADDEDTSQLVPPWFEADVISDYAAGKKLFDEAIGVEAAKLDFAVSRAEGMERGYPDGNPKTTIGATKLPLDVVPPVAVQHLALAFKDGADKYGAFNWRDQPVSASVYYAAALRHLFAWFDGEDKAEDSGVHHLAHVMACCAIILDCDKLNDNRPTPGAAATMQKEYKA